MSKCILCPSKAKKGSVYCGKCSFRAHTAGDAAPKGTFKKTTVGRVKIVQTGIA